KARPGKDNHSGAGFAQALKFANRGLIVCGRSPVLTVPFKERNRAAMRQVAAKLFLIHEDESLVERNSLDKCTAGSFETASRRRRNGAAFRTELSCVSGYRWMWNQHQE